WKSSSRRRSFPRASRKAGKGRPPASACWREPGSVPASTLPGLYWKRYASASVEDRTAVLVGLRCLRVFVLLDLPARLAWFAGPFCFAHACLLLALRRRFACCKPHFRYGKRSIVAWFLSVSRWIFA